MLNNEISSFKLKRGYMATLAQNADGSPILDAAGQPTHVKGCGKRHYMGGKEGIEKNPASAEKYAGEYPLYITCRNPECGAIVRGFPNLTRFEPVD